MNKYESVIILKPDLGEELTKETIEKFENLIKSFSNESVEIEDKGKRKLAYAIKNNVEGHYVVYYFNAKCEDIQELERVYRITDEVMRFIVVRKDDRDE